MFGAAGTMYASNFRPAAVPQHMTVPSNGVPSTNPAEPARTQNAYTAQFAYTASTPPPSPAIGVDYLGDEGRLVGWEMDPGIIPLVGDGPPQNLALSYRFLRTRATTEIHLCTCLRYEPVEVRSADILRFKPNLRHVRYCAIADGHVRVEIDGEHRSLLKSDDVFIVPAGRGFKVQNSMYDAVTLYVYTRVLSAPGTSSNRMEGMPYQPENSPLHYAGSRPSHATLLTSRFLCKDETCGYCHCVRFDIILLEAGGKASFPPDSNATRYCTIPRGKLHVDVQGQEPFLIGKHGLFIIRKGLGFSIQSVVQVPSKLYIVTLLTKASPVPVS